MTDEPLQSRVKFLVCADDTEHAHMALRFACARARRRRGHIDLLHVLEPVDFQGLVAVADRMRDERRAEAEAMLARLAREVQDISGITPAVVLREGAVAEQILAAASEDMDASMIVLGAEPPPGGNRELISFLARQLGSKLTIPLVIVPGNLTDQQIEELS